MDDRSEKARCVVGGVDTHKDLHVAAVVDERDHVLATRCFATTRQGYRQLLQWMRSFGTLARVGVESTGTYGAGLLRHLHAAGVDVLEVTVPDKQERRRRGKDDGPPNRIRPSSDTSSSGPFMAELRPSVVIISKRIRGPGLRWAKNATVHRRTDKSLPDDHSDSRSERDVGGLVVARNTDRGRPEGPETAFQQACLSVPC